MSTTEASDMRKRPSTPKPVNESRRRLLGSAIGAGAAAGLGFATVSAQAAPTAGAAPTENKKKGYRETEHIRRYYQTADR
ncbi:hypothetical protein [Algiphilus aromaticivorans]|uniref:hypothetical protein n=1 Tax=Algiphilus aromaticivorans TaxID=382454 RepID=UPI001E443636|nr:hypothetical protein [Algiphilus aromaticivorans]